MKKLILPHFFILLPIFIFTLFVIFLPIQNVVAQTGRNCLGELNESRGECIDVHTACVDACPGAQGVDLSSLGSCLKSCDKQQGLCNDVAKGAYDVCVRDRDTKPAGKVVNCEEVREILGSEGCQHFIIDGGDIWCSQTGEELIPEESAQGLKFPYKNRPPDYMIDRSSDFFSENTELAAKCLDRSGSQETNAQPDQSQSGQTGKQKKQSKDGNPLNIFGVNPFQTWLNLNAFAKAGAFIKSGAAERFTETTIQHMVGIEPLWEREAREEAAFNIFLNSSQDRLNKLGGKNGSEETLGDLDNRLEAVNEPVTVKKDSATIQLHPLDGQTGVLDASGGKTELKSGGADVIVEPQDGQQFQMQTPNVEIFVIGTEFSVTYNNKKNETIVAVYKGKVGIKANDGKTTTISPDGDKPGVVVVSQKLSPTKLAIAGVVLAAVIGGVVFLKKRGLKLASPKKKSSR